MEKQIPNLPIKAIQAFKNEEIIKNGLTIPFLVGIYQQYAGIDLSSPKCVEIIINDIVNNQDEQEYLLSKCGEVREYVLSIPDDAIDTGRSINNTKGHKILHLPMYHSDIYSDTIDDLAAYLYNIYRDIIMAERFSKRNGEWKSYNQTELMLIDEILSRNG